MSGVELKANDAKALPAIKRRSVLSSIHVVPILSQRRRSPSRP